MELLADSILLFAQPPFMVFITMIGYWLILRAPFARAIILLSFTLILSTYLKSFWKIPLAPHLGDGWAFPSGHMMATAVFWSWLFIEFPRRIHFVLLIIVLIGVGWGLIFKHYHNLTDVVGAFGFSLVVLGAYALITKRIPQHHQPKMAWVLVPMGCVMIVLMGRIFPHHGAALGGLAGFSLGWWYSIRANTFPKNNTQKYVRFIICFIGSLALVGIFSCFKFTDKPHLFFLMLVHCFLQGFWISYGVAWFTSLKIMKKRNKT